MKHVKKLSSGLLAGAAALALGAAVLPSAVAAPAPTVDGQGLNPVIGATAHREDNRPGPLSAKQDALREKAIATLQNGGKVTERADGGATMKLASAESKETKYYEFPVNRTDKILTMLGEFGGDGPLHNQIAKPNRSRDNSTVWAEDFNVAHYDKMFNGDGESFKNYYKQLSAGRYDVSLTTENWVKVPGNAATYGASGVEDAGGAWKFIEDTGNAWYAAQKAAGKTDAQITDYLKQFDKWDRNDFDGDGNFNEPDGYVDHFQAIHAGVGEEAGGGKQGANAIWSHRWYINTGFGTAGPKDNLAGGAQIGKSGIWIGDYTVEPENGGLGVFTHEFGHDLGLPDYYDTAKGDNGTGFWTLMSAGSWLSHGTAAKEGIGTTPGLMGPQEKFELGWLDYSEVNKGQRGTYRLGASQHVYDNPATTKNEADQAVKVNLPDKTQTIEYTKPTEGTKAWWSGRGDDLTSTMTRDVAAADTVTVTAKAWYQIEKDFDYLYAEYSVDGGTTWKQIGDAYTGKSDWKDLNLSYPAGGKESKFRFRYKTDAGTNEAGAFIDNINVKAGDSTFADGAEAGDNGWTVKGFSVSTGSDTKVTPQYFWLENRQYVGYDATLKAGPYNSPESVTRPDWVESFAYRPGMLVWYVDFSYPNNNTSQTPGHGRALPVDARPKPFMYNDDTMPGNRRQPFDATFGLQGVPRTCLHKQEEADNAAGYKSFQACTSSGAKPTFRDSSEDAYWSRDNRWGSTKLPGSGMTAQVTDEKGKFLTVRVNNP